MMSASRPKIGTRRSVILRRPGLPPERSTEGLSYRNSRAKISLG